MKVGDKIIVTTPQRQMGVGSIVEVTQVDSSTASIGGVWVRDAKGHTEYLLYDEYERLEHSSSDQSLTSHPTGALRESKEGKGLPHLLLAGFPRALTALSKHMDCPLGRERNWEKGLPESSLIDSGFRHLMGYVSGVSEDSPEYNLTACAWNVMVLLEEYLRVKEGEMGEEVLDVSKPE